YLPTLYSDYATQDQWRAFRYSTAAQTAVYRGNACAEMIFPFYVQTGRPLVWPSECIEHAFAARISDFVFLRPIALLLVLATVVVLGRVLAPALGGLALGVVAATALVTSPSYSFMYLQGLPAAMVLLCVILAALSFGYFSQRNALSKASQRRSIFH